MVPGTPEECFVSSPAVPGHLGPRVPATPDGALLGAPARPFFESLDPAPMTPGLPATPAPMTPGLPVASQFMQGPPLPRTPNVVPNAWCPPRPPWLFKLTQPLAPPVSREAGCFLTFGAACCSDLANCEILSSLLIC
jgi:hypothetical protein